MERHGVHFASATEVFNTSTPDGRAALNQRMTFAQWEREVTSQRLIDKFSENARKGWAHSGLEPYGYDADYKHHTLRINPEEAAHVKTIFQLAARGESLASIRRQINAKGSRTKPRNYRKGNDATSSVGNQAWTVKSLRRLIESPRYRGVTRDSAGNEYPANWEPIVTEEMWRKANEAINQSARKRRASYSKSPSLNKHELVLKGIFRCGHCGKAISPRPGGRRRTDGSQRGYYSCQDVIEQGEHSTCEVRNLPGDEFDQFIVRLLGAFAQHPQIIRETLKAARQEKKSSVRPLRSKRAQLRKDLTQLNAEIKHLLSLAKKGVGNFSRELYQEAEEVSRQKAALQSTIEQTNARIHFLEQVSADEQSVSKALSNFSQLFYTLAYEERAELMSLLIRSLSIRRINLERDSLPCPLEPTLQGKPVTYYELHIEFFIQSIFSQLPGDADSTKTSSQKFRSRLSSTFIAGLVGQRWNTGAFLAYPFRMERNIPHPKGKPPKFRINRSKHILCSIIEWQHTLCDYPEFGLKDVASQVGLSQIRVRHLMRLVKLEQRVIDEVCSMSVSKQQKISVRLLMRMLKMPPDEQYDHIKEVMYG